MTATATFPPGLTGPLEVQWYLDGVPYGDLQIARGDQATVTLPELNHGAHALTLTCLSPSTEVPLLVQMAGALIVNSPPTLPRFGFTVTENTACVVPLLGLVTGIHDPDGDPVQVLQIEPRSVLGARVTRVGDSLVYDPVPGSSGTDTIRYEAADPWNGRASGLINVQIRAPSNTAKISVAQGHVDVTFTTAPSKAFAVETTSDLQNWTPLTSFSGEQASYRLDTVQRGGDFSRFYRVRFQ